MNDFEMMTEMLKRRGYREVAVDDLDPQPARALSFAVCRPPDAGFQGAVSIELPPGYGYYGFRCSLLFDSDGCLIGHAVWETAASSWWR